MRLFLSVLTFIFILFIVPSATYANGITLNPAFTQITLDELNQSKSQELKITNNTNQHISLSLSALDFRQQGEDGAISFEGIDSSTYSYTLASFLRFSEDTVELDPGQTEVVTVFIENNQSLSPGGHYAAIVAKLVDQSDSSLEQSVNPSIASLFLVRKEGGDKFNLSLLRHDFPDSLIAFSIPTRINLVFQNSGNVHLIPYGRVEVRDIFGNLLSEGMVNPSSKIILPGSRRKTDVVMTKIKSIPVATVATVSFKGQDSLKKASYVVNDLVVIVNPKLAGISLIIILLSILYLIYRYRRKK